jgi:hypothetical protein
MKLRIHANSVRLRLSRSEVARLTETGRLEEKLDFPGGARLIYAIESGDVPVPQASFDAATIRVKLPRDWVDRWATTGEVGISGECVFDGHVLAVLVEKDFQCTHADPDPDAYPNVQPGTGDEAA